MAWDNFSKVLRIPKLLVPSQGAHPKIYTRNNGVLADGTTFLVYHFLLYTNGFNQQTIIKNMQSVFWCYIMLLRLDGVYQKRSASARELTLSAVKKTLTTFSQIQLMTISWVSPNVSMAWIRSGRRFRSFLIFFPMAGTTLLRLHVRTSWVIQPTVLVLSPSLDVGRRHEIWTWIIHPIFIVDVFWLYALMRECPT